MAGTYSFDFNKQPGRRRTRFYAPDPKDALVSIITPYYNAGKYFEQTFNSVMNQTFPWFEWIIVNDGSPNQADVELLHSFATKDKRITVFTQENAGPSKARNTAVEFANTNLIVTLDADDLIDPTYLECLYWSLRYNPDAAWSYSNSYGFQEQEYIWKYPFSAETIKTFNFLNYTAMIRKKDFFDIGGYKIEKQAYHEDWRFWLDMLSMSKKPIRINSCLFWYRRLSSGRMSSVNNDKKLTADSDRIIEKVSETVDVNVQPLIYPVKNSQYPYYKPKFETWDIRAFEEHKNKRIMWLIPWMMMGGADKFNFDAIVGLKKNGFQNFILATQPSENEWRQKFEDCADEIFVLPDFLDPAHYLEFVSYYIQTREIDAIILTNSYDGYYMMPWIRQRFPDVAIVDYVHMEEWYWKNGGYARASANIAGITEKTFVCNSLTRDVMIDNFGRDPETVDCLYIGVDHEYFAQENETPGYLHELLNLPQERPIVLFPCRIHPQKRPFLMLEIANRVRKNLPEVAFVVVGTGDQFEELQEQIKEKQLEDTVYCIGATDKMRACYRDSAVTLICSLKEGLALTAYESLSMKTPVISSDVGGQRDLIDNTVGALLPLYQSEELELDNREFKDEEVDQYVNAVLKILQNPELRQQFGDNGRKKIEGGFTLKQMVRNLYDYITVACSNSAMKVRRNHVAEILREVPVLCDDYISTYLLANAKDAETEAIWKVKLEVDGYLSNLQKDYTKLLNDYENLRITSKEVWDAKCQLAEEVKNLRITSKEVWEAKCQLTDELKAMWESRCYFEQKYLEASNRGYTVFLRKCYRKIRQILGRLYRKIVRVF